jgi:predicted lipoprotein
MLKVTSPLAATRVASDAIEETNRPGCQEWREMLRAYPAAMQQYCQAVMSLMALDAATFNDGWTKAEQARKVCEDYREKLFHHRHEHGCFTSRGS